MMALGLVRAALDAEHERIIVATRDTDLLPAIEMAEEELPGSVILVAWDGESTLKAGLQLPSLSLNLNDYNKSRDTGDYR